ncbi:MAG: hypothetical protein NT134_05355 [Chloroflexi bacterium]|nr:hypothetical protein [Chloroflexota bacterium]
MLLYDVRNRAKLNSITTLRWEAKLIVLGIAIGYPDEAYPINHFRSEREPLDSVAKWYGFD